MINIGILTAPRSGSNYFCECMTQAGAFGHVDGFSAGTGELLATQFEKNTGAWIAQHSNGNIHACKLSLEYLDHVIQYAALSKIITFLDSFTHLIVLDRPDTIAQAVSYYLADTTKEWTSTAKTGLQVPAYDYHYILWYYALLQGLRNRVNVYIQNVQKPVMAVRYEQFVGSEKEYLNTIAEFCGITLADFSLNPTLQRQNTPLKEAYIRRFREDRDNVR